eukprot:gnl/TRDRNA2_/TRDRNA2_148117_c0_seq1.p1 gnl/TRDRNA2_/TRDRNA2_148117_c0~~gnl/TRDRNA2_/TRDRNA2_148117_c0_seq1.p1  ORF type:complete len:535 (-),score=59.80 gnl/TRDRNA2_/TRDRNA2_148117_c0_seq1:209-1813(-)
MESAAACQELFSDSHSAAEASLGDSDVPRVSGAASASDPAGRRQAPARDGPDTRDEAETPHVSPQQQVANATRGSPWLVVYVGEEEGGQVQILRPDSPPEAADPANVRTSTTHEAALVLIETAAESYRTIQKVVRGIQTKNYICFPIVGVILRAPSDSPRWIDVMLRQRHVLKQWNVHDVMLQSACQEAMSWDLQVCVQKAQGFAEKDAEIEFCQNPRQFFSRAHSKLPRFPKEDPELSYQPEVGVNIGSHCKIQKLLHNGTRGAVFLTVKKPSDEFQVLKAVRKDAILDFHTLRRLWIEWSILEDLDHPNIVYSVGRAHGTTHLYTLMAYAGPCNLGAIIRGYDGTDAPWWSQGVFHQLALALAYLHAADVAHRDLIPENIVLNKRDLLDCTVKPHVTLTGFRLAVRTAKACTEHEGTLPFLAPEVLSREPFDAAAADVWSLGVLLLEILFGLNSLSDVLGWTDQRPDTQRALDDLKKLFGDINVFLEHVGNDLSFEMHSGLKDLLVGVFTWGPAERWRARRLEASPWARAGI